MSDSISDNLQNDAQQRLLEHAPWLVPLKPHDSFSFEQLANEYNLLNISSFSRVLTNLIVEELIARGVGSRVLDIGCGCGIGREVGYQWVIRHHTQDLWGIEPDDGIRPAESLFDHFQQALLETADLPVESFDVAYSSMVMEHVADPENFFASLHRCLKPGGVYLFATPNAWSFVPWLTKVSHQLGIDELIIRVLRGKQQVEEYHYPVQFRCNTAKQLNALARASGFAPPQYAFVEGTGSYSYLRGPLRLLKGPLKAKRRWIRRPDRLATLICKMRRAEA